MSLHIDSVIDKITPALIIMVIIALFGMYIRIGYLEQVAKMALAGYDTDKIEITQEISQLQLDLRTCRENIIRLQEKIKK